MIRTRNLFYSKQERLFSIWRILRLLLISVPLVIITNKLFVLLKLPFGFSPIAKLIFIASIILVTIFLDKERIQDLGLELKMKSILYIIAGIVWAYFLYIQCESICTIKSNTAFQFVNPFTIDNILSLGYYLLFIGLSEELMFRGYMISNISRDTNYIIALIISAILFSLIHLGSGDSIKNILLMGFTFTIFFGLIFIMTKNIFLAIGFHGAWDTFERLFHPLFKSADIGSNTILIILLINVFIFYLIFRKRLNFDIKTLTKHCP